LSAEQALDTLGLTAEATPDEIKQAYRDLVKVWHPDRFDSDARLRAKAEDRLKQINAAYRALEAGDLRHESAAPSAAADPPTYASTSATKPPTRSRASGDRTIRVFLYVVSAAVLAALAGFAVHQIGANLPRPPAPAAQQAAAEPEAVAAATNSRRPQPHSANRSRSGAADFQVWSPSEADSDRLQLACSSHKPGSEAYRNCIKAQVDALRPADAAPELVGLNRFEREAAKMACANARRSGGESGYRRCVMEQLAAVAAEPIRPDMSGLSEADRNSIDAACLAARKQGAAEYDRCVARFAKTLAEAQQPVR
jgi:curved DNA-binding protein CbpA